MVSAVVFDALSFAVGPVEVLSAAGIIFFGLDKLENALG
jgi:hypothetical protein